MNPNLYIDERPEKEPPKWEESDDHVSGGGGGGGGGGAGGLGGGAWWDGGGSETGGGTGPEWVYDDLSVKSDYTALRISAGGRLMQDDPRGLIHCGRLCPYIPPLLVYIRGESDEVDVQKHRRCALIRLVYLDNCGRYLYDDAPVDVSGMGPGDGDNEEKDGIPAYVGGFPLCEPEEKLEVYARWQGGHWKREDVRDMRIFLFGVDIGWSVVPVDNWKRMATITVDETFHIRVNGISAKLGGNKGRLHADH